MTKLRTLLTTVAVLLAAVSPALATDTSKTYNSGILVLFFVGFCALLIVAQLVPAVLALFGLTREAAKGASRRQQTATARKQSH